MGFEARALEAALTEDLLFVKGLESVGAAERLSLEMIVKTVQRLVEVEATLAEAGIVVGGSKQQPRAHPLLAAERSLRADVSRELERLGLTPLARQKAIVRHSRRETMDGPLADLVATGFS